MTTPNAPETEITEHASDMGIAAETGPGRRLQEARTSQQMSREDVAKHMHLDIKIIGALEENRFESLSAPIFVRGYLRSYSRLLSLPADEILAAYDQLGIGAPPPVVNQPTAVEGLQSAPVAMLPPRRFIYIGIAAVILLLPLALWKMGVFSGGGKPAIKETPTQEEANPSMELALPPPMEETTAIEPAAPVPTAKPATPPPIAKSVPAVPVTPPSPVKPVAPAVAPQPPKPALPVANAKPAVPVTSVATTANAKPATPAVSSEGTTVTMKFSESVWVEVTDATGKRLIYSLGTKGETKTAQGIPPLKVGIGHVPGVTVEFNGKRYDYSRYVERGVAKFSLGESGKSGNQ